MNTANTNTLIGSCVGISNKTELYNMYLAYRYPYTGPNNLPPNGVYPVMPANRAYNALRSDIAYLVAGK